jgi:hypothetical protein
MKRFIAQCLFAAVLLGAAVTAGAADNVTVSWQEGGAGLWRSTKLPEVGSVYDVQSADGVVYFATDRGIYMAREGGRAWTRYVNLNNGKPVPFYSIAVAPGKVYAGGNGGLAITSDKGATWNIVISNPTFAIQALCEQDGLLYAGSTGVFVSRDGGARFQSFPTSPQSFIETLTYGAGTLWVITADDENNRTLFESSDAGATWKKRTSMALKSGGTEFSVDPMDFVASGDTLSLSAGNFLYYSLDAGSTWKQKSASSTKAITHSLAADGDFVFSDLVNRLRWVTKDAVRDLEWPPGAAPVWSYVKPVNGVTHQPVLLSPIPDKSITPGADWSKSEIQWVLNAQNQQKGIAASIPEIEQVNPSIGMADLIRYLAVDGPVLYAATMDGRVYRYPVPRGTTSLPPTSGAELDIQNRLDAAFASQNMATVDSLLATVQGMNDWSQVLLYYRGFRRLSNQDPAAALGDFNQLLALNSGVVDAYFFRGIAYQNLGRHTVAIQDFTVVINNKSARAPFAQGNRGISYLHLNDPIKARADLEAAVKAGVTDAQKYIDQYLK